MTRLETAAARHDTAGDTLVAAMAQVEAARQAVAEAQMGTGPGTRPETAIAAEPVAGLAATLRHLGGVADDTELLLRQAEALAETVLAGQAPGLPPLLASRAPALLAQVETTIHRLRSVATALALASDGPAGDRPAGDRRGGRAAA